ncbi:flavin-containing monooxygenase [Anditalea andensis]|uniref:Potassium transporter Trk n=1 Tax=Anditalea andensis TaxID=1048983 RepID=A0A074L1K1_9BACT|nr:NAD(P)/FAD-dependent oxidoreductase [Anditalea andensis]KEO73728.1 hypothetical protein EL17_10905 [Anditalea andensis]
MHKNILVVGASHYGLTISYYLKQQGKDFLILEKNDRVGDNWRQRFESMKLFSPAKYATLPGLPIALDDDARPTKNQMADYNERYIDHLDIPVLTNVEVKSISLADNKYVVKTDQGIFTADMLIMANGMRENPVIPQWIHKLAVPSIHLKKYRNPVSVKGKKVLVSGNGNSSAQIAAELIKYFEVEWARDPKIKHTPLYVLGKHIHWWKEKIKWNKNTTSEAQPIFICDDLKSKLKKVTKRSKVEDANGSLVAFDDGTSAQYDFIIFSDGYDPDYNLINIPHFEIDLIQLRNDRGIASIPGLFFIGVPYQRSHHSLNPNIALDDVRYILDHI